MCDRSEEHREQPNRFPRRFLKFTVRVIMLVYMAKKKKEKRQTIKFECIPVVNLLFVLQGNFSVKIV